MSNAGLTRAPLPWQAQPWQQITLARTQQRLAHGLLFVGREGLGQRHLAELFAAVLLCPHVQQDLPCGTCHSCAMMRAGTHPDFLIVEPEKTTIGVDAIRALSQLVQETTTQGGYKVVIIDPASAMNMNAANALLKTLEEPTPQTLIILISDESLRLPKTILSRCQKIIFPAASLEVATAWLQDAMEDKQDVSLLLQLAAGSPLLALAYAKDNLLQLRQQMFTDLQALTMQKADPLKLAHAWQEHPPLAILALLQSAVMDIVRLQQAGMVLVNTDYLTLWQGLAARISSEKVFSYLDYLQETRRVLLANLTLNKPLWLEDLLIRWVQCF